MYRDELQDAEDLRVEIVNLKKQLSNIAGDNHLLKVKIRKLQSEIIKKDKQMDVMLDPRKSIDVRKILYERSASFVLNMKEKNDELLYLLREKDVLIRRLQNQLNVAKLYSQPAKKQFQCKCLDHTDLDNKIRLIQMNMIYNKRQDFNCNSEADTSQKHTERPLSWTSGMQEAESTLIEETLGEKSDSNKNKEHVKEQYKNLSRDHLLSIIENLKNNQRHSSFSYQTNSRKSSPESDLEKTDFFCESPHEEIQQLHLHFLDMISEVDNLKCKIAQLQNNQEKTENVLKNKNTNFDKLSQEVKNLKRFKPRSKSSRSHSNKCYSSTDLVARVYSADNTRNNRKTYTSNEQNKQLKNTEKKRNFKGKKSDQATDSERSLNLRKNKQNVKDAIIQVEISDSLESGNQCTYIENGSVTITRKPYCNDVEKTEKEYEYHNEVFEECEEESELPAEF